ncbi:hypothetical protein B9T62_19310 [Paenibacillus donghaensis]|uniref:Uncharacterized protein n=2 Tax=Paenibacillus donghaensis TaxID=414771 RepID=A0A2Z2KB56_9BACL|nr:hypothetical protein B9T62_19310 [Paenibacillus donghaensis]
MEYAKHNNIKILIEDRDYLHMALSDHVDYICSCGETHSRRLRNIMNGSVRCPKCIEIKKVQTSFERFGCANPMQNSVVRAKTFKTFNINNSMSISLQQAYIHSITSGDINYLCEGSFLDIAFPEENIYIEYDGGLHDGKVKFGLISEKKFKEKERRRRYALYRNGWN